MNKGKFLWILLIAVTFFIAACTSHKKESNDNTIQEQDTAGLAEYQKWKMESELREKIEAENQESRQTIVAAPVKSGSSARSSSSRGNQTYRSDGTYSSGSSTNGAASAPVPEKKGMSHTAKGAIVGAASGAVIGAVANKKNRVGGGVVGGVIGAATGAGVGAIVDKKERQKNDN